MQITHEQAHQLIQRRPDKALNKQETAVLAAHLHDCSECQAYAREIQEVEELLSPILKRQWSLQPVPLSIQALIQRKHSANNPRVLTIRRAMVGLVVAAVFFSAWQFVQSGTPAPIELPIGVFPIPTPSAQSTPTKVTFEGCEMIPYPVTETDTLASIAQQFSVSEEAIMAVNDLKTDTIHAAMELVIPMCQSTPTGTANPATLTASQTYMPRLRPRTSTPRPGG